jgi:hypothetical protein
MPSHPIWHGGIAKSAYAVPVDVGDRFLLIKDHRAHFGRIDMRAQAGGPSALRADTTDSGQLARVLHECEGVTFGTTGVRVHKAASGEVTVTDGPFAETKEILGGYALLNAASKEEAVEHTRRFLDHVGQGTCEGNWDGTWETYQLFEMPTV